MWALRARFAQVLNAYVLSHIMLMSLKHSKCLSIAQDFLTGEEFQIVSSCTSKSKTFGITNRWVDFL